MRIALAGATGNFGRLARGLFENNGHSVTGIGRNEWVNTDLSSYDICFLSVPVTEVERYLQNCRDCTVIEISSVKEPIRNLKGRLISIHPIFGPRSVNSEEFRNIIYVNDLSMEGGREIVRQLFPNFTILDMTAEAHDRAMVEVLIKPFLMSKLASGISDVSLNFKGPSQAILQQLASISGSESSGVLMDTIKLNPYSVKAIKDIVETAKNLVDELQKK